MAATPLSPDEVEALRADVRADGIVDLTPEQVCRLDAGKTKDLALLRIAVEAGDTVHVELSARDTDSGKFLNVRTAGRIALQNGHVTSAQFDQVAVGKLDISSWLRGRELGPDVDRSLQERAADDPELARRLGAFRSLEVRGGAFHLELEPASVDELLGAPGSPGGG